MPTMKVKKTEEVEEEIQIQPVVAGGIYRILKTDDTVEEALCLATREKQGCKKRGLFRTFGEADAWYEEGDDALIHWKLIRKSSDVEEKPAKKTRRRTTKPKE